MTITDESWADVIDLISSVDIAEAPRDIIPPIPTRSVVTGFHKMLDSHSSSVNDASGEFYSGHKMFDLNRFDGGIRRGKDQPFTSLGGSIVGCGSQEIDFDKECYPSC